MRRPARFDVLCSPRALTWIERVYAEAASGEGGAEGHGFAATNARYLRRVLEDFIPTHALDPKFGLGNGLFRAKGARWRVVWAASSAKGTAIVLLVGHRKDGDRNDVYALLDRILATEEFDDLFAWLGATKPKPRSG